MEEGRKEGKGKMRKDKFVVKYRWKRKEKAWQRKHERKGAQ